MSNKYFEILAEYARNKVKRFDESRFLYGEKLLSVPINSKFVTIFDLNDIRSTAQKRLFKIHNVNTVERISPICLFGDEGRVSICKINGGIVYAIYVLSESDLEYLKEYECYKPYINSFDFAEDNHFESVDYKIYFPIKMKTCCATNRSLCYIKRVCKDGESVKVIYPDKSERKITFDELFENFTKVYGEPLGTKYIKVGWE